MQLHTQPFKPRKNNRKMTKARIKAFNPIQSIPVWERDENNNKGKFLGYKYINHFKQNLVEAA